MVNWLAPALIDLNTEWSLNTWQWDLCSWIAAHLQNKNQHVNFVSWKSRSPCLLRSAPQHLKLVTWFEKDFKLFIMTTVWISKISDRWDERGIIISNTIVWHSFVAIYLLSTYSCCGYLSFVDLELRPLRALRVLAWWEYYRRPGVSRTSAPRRASSSPDWESRR